MRCSTISHLVIQRDFSGYGEDSPSVISGVGTAPISLPDRLDAFNPPVWPEPLMWEDDDEEDEDFGDDDDDLDLGDEDDDDFFDDDEDEDLDDDEEGLEDE